MSSWLITGTNRGLGLEIVRQLATSPLASAIIATARGQPSAELQEITSSSNGKVHFVQFDTTCTLEEATEVAKRVGKILGGKLDILVNNAGINFTKKVEDLATPDLMRVIATNVGGVHTTTQAFLPLLRAGKDKKIANISSVMGSLALWESLQFDTVGAYKVSKAALNGLTKQWSYELKKEDFIVFPLSPGWLKTDMGGSQAPKEVATGAQSVIKVIAEAGPNTNGVFLNEDNEVQPW